MVVGRDHGRAAAALDVDERVDEHLAADAVEVRGGLVGDQQQRLADQGAGDGHELALSVGQSAHQGVEMVGQADGAERLGRAHEHVALRLGAHLERQRDVAQSGEVAQQRERLRHHADVPPQQRDR